MRNSSLILNGILVVAVGVLYYLHFARQDGSRNSGSSAATADATTRTVANQNAAKRIVYVNTDSLTKKYAYYQQASKELEEKQGKLDTELGGRFRALQNEAVALQQKANTLTQEQGQQAEQQLMRKQQDLEQYRARLGQQFLEDQRKKNEEIYETIAQYLRKRNEGSRYDYVLGYTKGANVLFANDSLDITEQVIEELNKEYQAVNTPKKK
ncbi:MAG: OmpH family outer membrane protein [Ferruginibacter sp.]|nr:OmpH family outer membrane protein [Cytophagales bacterium]